MTKGPTEYERVVPMWQLWLIMAVILGAVGAVMYVQRNLDYTTDTSVYQREEKPSIHRKRDPAKVECTSVPCNVPAVFSGGSR